MKISIGCGTLTAILAILKLAHVIEIGWLWVLAPIWIPLALFAALFIIVCIIALIIKD